MWLCYAVLGTVVYSEHLDRPGSGQPPSGLCVMDSCLHMPPHSCAGTLAQCNDSPEGVAFGGSGGGGGAHLDEAVNVGELCSLPLSLSLSLSPALSPTPTPPASGALKLPCPQN